MADFAVNMECSLPGEPEENATQLLDATRGAMDDDAWATVAVNEQARSALLAVRVDAEDALDALTVAQDAFVNAWEEAFSGMALPEVLVVKASPWRRAAGLGLLMPHPDDEDAPVTDEEPAEAGA